MVWIPDKDFGDDKNRQECLFYTEKTDEEILRLRSEWRKGVIPAIILVIPAIILVIPMILPVIPAIFIVIPMIFLSFPRKRESREFKSMLRKIGLDPR